MITQILQDADLFKRHTAYLKSVSPIYPKMHFEEKDGCIWATTLVPFIYNDRRYLRHHVESIVPNKHVGVTQLQNKLVNEAEKTIKFGSPCKFDDIS